MIIRTTFWALLDKDGYLANESTTGLIAVSKAREPIYALALAYHKKTGEHAEIVKVRISK